MKTTFLRRWSRPRTILVISSFTESPAHTLQVVNGFRSTGARVFLAQLSNPASIAWRSDCGPCLVENRPASVEPQSTGDLSQAFLWAEILSEVTVLKDTPVARIPVLADSLGVDLVVLTSPEIGQIRLGLGNQIDRNLFGSLRMPALICSVRMNTTAWTAREFRRILLPIDFGSDLAFQMRFACRFARRHHGRITVLHVFENDETAGQSWERTLVAVEARLPIAELKQEGILCPLEIAVCSGYPARKILAYNEQRPHDLIVMGDRRRMSSIRKGGFNVAGTVCAEARCPVLMLGDAIDTAPELKEFIPQLNFV